MVDESWKTNATGEPASIVRLLFRSHALAFSPFPDPRFVDEPAFVEAHAFGFEELELAEGLGAGAFATEAAEGEIAFDHTVAGRVGSEGVALQGLADGLR